MPLTAGKPIRTNMPPYPPRRACAWFPGLLLVNVPGWPNGYCESWLATMIDMATLLCMHLVGWLLDCIVNVERISVYRQAVLSGLHIHQALRPLSRPCCSYCSIMLPIFRWRLLTLSILIVRFEEYFAIIIRCYKFCL